MLLEEQRFLHEDLERLEQGISDRVAEDPRHVNALKYLIYFEYYNTHNSLRRFETDSIVTTKSQASSIASKSNPNVC